MCEHEWQGKFAGACPYGSAMFGDVTWPDAAKARSLNAALVDEMAHNRFWIVVSVMYSYVPFLVVFGALLRLGVRRGTMELWMVALLALTFICNELILKNLIRQPRPEVSCVESCGMPSSHSAFALTAWTFFLVDLLWRMDLSTRRSACPSALELWRASAWDVLAWDEVLFWGFFWSLLLLPVPASRVFLHDHSLEQVLAGALVGAASSACAWIAGRCLQKKYNHLLGEELLGYRGNMLLCHNMALPYSELLHRCRTEAARSMVQSPPELAWYIEQISRQLRDTPSDTAKRLRLEAAKSNLEGFVNRRTVHDRTQELLRAPSSPLLNAPEESTAPPTVPETDAKGASATSVPAISEAPEPERRGSESTPSSALPLEITQATRAPAAEGGATSSYPCSPTGRASAEASEERGPASFVSAASDAAVAEEAEEASPAAEANVAKEVERTKAEGD